MTGGPCGLEREKGRGVRHRLSNYQPGEVCTTTREPGELLARLSTTYGAVITAPTVCCRFQKPTCTLHLTSLTGAHFVNSRMA